jgi:hypothetical protein
MKTTVAAIQQRTDIMERIWSHYDHAREKHPHFCDLIKSDELPFDFVGWNLDNCRRLLEHAKAIGVVRWDELLDCEKYEAMAEIYRGDNAAAVEELYDAIAVLLRTIDVLEGRQALGKKGGEK